MARSPEDQRRFLTKAVVTIAAVVVGMVHVVWPHVKIDSITVVLFVVAVIPWLDHLVKSIQTPFFSFEYRELEKRLDLVTGEAASAKRLAEAGEARELARQDARRSNAAAGLNELAREYNRVRESMPPGDARTSAMTSVVGKMIAAVESGDQIDARDCLGGADPGLRLAAYVSLYTEPDPTLVIPLVDSIVAVEDKPFGAYWALRSLWRLIESGDADILDLNSLRRLRRLQQELPPDSDRAAELSRILQLADS